MVFYSRLIVEFDRRSRKVGIRVRVRARSRERRLSLRRRSSGEQRFDDLRDGNLSFSTNGDLISRRDKRSVPSLRRGCDKNAEGETYPTDRGRRTRTEGSGSRAKRLFPRSMLQSSANGTRVDIRKLLGNEFQRRRSCATDEPTIRSNLSTYENGYVNSKNVDFDGFRRSGTGFV